MKLVSLKNANDPQCCAPMPSANYGYGLRIHLNDDQCEALGIKAPLKAGTQVKISAAALVVAATQSVESDGDDAGPDIELDLQIIEMGIEAGAVRKDAAEVLYGNSGG